MKFFPQDYKPDEDPAIFKSVKTGRGPLGPNWKVMLKLAKSQIMAPCKSIHTA